MLERRIVPEEACLYGYMYIGGTTAVKNGTAVKFNGIHSNTLGPITPNGQWSDKTFPTSGVSFAVLLDTDAIATTQNTFLAKKYEYQKEGSDLSLDAIYSGESIVVYNQGFFDTDQYLSTITPATSVGTKLYVSGGKFTSTATNANVVRAIYWGIKSSYDTNYWNAAPVYIQLLPVAYSG